jgi:hypothetical protein
MKLSLHDLGSLFTGEVQNMARIVGVASPVSLKAVCEKYGTRAPNLKFRNGFLRQGSTMR